MEGVESRGIEGRSTHQIVVMIMVNANVAHISVSGQWRGAANGIFKKGVCNIWVDCWVVYVE